MSLAGPKDKREGVTRGTIKALGCPWCGEINTGFESLGDELVQNVVLECDLCKNMYEITALFEVTHMVAERHGKMLHDGHLRRNTGLQRGK